MLSPGFVDGAVAVPAAPGSEKLGSAFGSAGLSEGFGSGAASEQAPKTRAAAIPAVQRRILLPRLLVLAADLLDRRLGLFLDSRPLGDIGLLGIREGLRIPLVE